MKYFRAGFIAGFFQCLVVPTYASNGINLLGFGPQSIGMGSADLTTVSDSTALVINPATLSLINSRQFDIYAVNISSFNSNHSDMFGNDIDDIVVDGTFANLGYVHPINKKVVWAIGFNVLGGVGTEIQNMNTAFGTTDEFSSITSVVGFVTGLSFKLTKKTVVGASLILNSSRTEQKFFPNTSFSNGNQTFFGRHIKDVGTTSFSFKLGLLHHLSPETKLAIAYKSKTDLSSDNGTATFDMTAIGLGKVTYSQVNLAGFDQPQELGIGISHQFTKSWLVAGEINWLNWNHSITTASISASNPDNAFAPLQINAGLPLNWKDQYVFALGASYDMGKNRKILFGINLANNPVPAENMTPSLSAIATKHITAGYLHPFNTHHSINVAAEYQLKETASYTNNNLPFGQNTSIEFDIFILHLLYSYRW